VTDECWPSEFRLVALTAADSRPTDSVNRLEPSPCAAQSPAVFYVRRSIQPLETVAAGARKWHRLDGPKLGLRRFVNSRGHL